MKRFLFLCTVVAAVSIVLSGCANRDMQKVRQTMTDRCLNVLLSPAYEAYKLSQIQKNEPIDSVAYVQRLTAVLDSTVQASMATQQADGSWPDVEYECHLRSSWRPFTHQTRMLNMAKAYCSPASAYYQDEKVLQAALKGLDFWLQRRPQSTNWWANEIGGPRNMGDFGLLLQDKLSEQQFAGLIDYMNNSKIKITGQNKVWLCCNVMVRALLIDDEALFEEAIREMKSVIKIENDEGVQFDWSFHQHGRQQQFGNYGLSYLSSLTQIGGLFLGTRYTFNEQELSILRNYALEGMSWAVWRGEMETGSCGRQFVFRDAMKGKARTYALQLLALKKIDPAHADEYQQMFDAQMMGAPNVLKGIKHFYMSDMTYMRTDNWMAVLKMCSDRTVGAEAVNGENRKCEVMANGSLMIYQDGGEYNNIYPMWDWTRVPGVTCNVADHNDFPQEDRRIKGRSDIVGGLVGDNYGVSVMRVDADGLKANKSWYFTDRYILCLGSDISSANGQPVTTAVNQTFRREDPRAKTEGETAFTPRASFSGDRLQAVLHDQVGYYFPQRQQVSYMSGVQTGSWHAIHFDSSDDPVSAEVFNLAIHHGVNPSAATYSYVVMPRTNEQGLDSLIAHPGFTILKQSDDVHAVRFEDGTVRCVFFAPRTTLKVDDKIEILDIAEEIIMVFRREGNKVYITYVDPTSEKDSTIITFRGKWKGDNAYYDPERNVSVVEFDAKISHGKRLDTVCEIIE